LGEICKGRNGRKAERRNDEDGHVLWSEIEAVKSRLLEMISYMPLKTAAMISTLIMLSLIYNTRT
jgi:hypothetical protein